MGPLLVIAETGGTAGIPPLCLASGGLSAPALGASFISAGLFYGGAAAVAAPILIHLLARRRFKRIRWAAIDFLLAAERRNRRRLRLEEWLLMALRCLAVLMIAAMVARPFLRPSRATAWWGGATRTERVFVLDDSLSMAYTGTEGTVFNRAKEAVRRVIASVRQENPDDTITLVRMTEPAVPVESGTYLSDVQTDQLLARLDAMTPTQQTVDLGRVFDGVADLFERNPGITNAAVYLISDFQRQDWAGKDGENQRGGDVDDDSVQRTSGESTEGRATAEAAAASYVDRLQAWAQKDHGLYLILVNVGDDGAANRALTHVEIPSARLLAGAPGTLRAHVANFAPPGANGAVDVDVAVGAGQSPVGGSKTVRGLGPRQTAFVDLETDFQRPGPVAIRASMHSAPRDGLPTDNVRYFAADVSASLRILIVNGEPSSDPFDDEVTFLATALRPEGDVFSGNDVVIIDETRLEEADLDSYHVVVLANVYRLTDPAIDLMERFVRRGGGLMVFLGDQVDPDSYNLALYREGKGLLPAELTEVVRPPDVAHLVITDRLHVAVRALGGSGDPLGLGQVPFLRYFRCVTPGERSAGTRDDGMSLPSAAAGPSDPSTEEGPDSASAGEARDGDSGPRSSRVIARFTSMASGAPGDPALIERTYGKGRVILFTSTADKEWHLWPDHPTFLPVMMELVQHVARRSDSGIDYHVGETIELPIDPAVFGPDAVVRTPAYPSEREIGVTAVPASAGKSGSQRSVDQGPDWGQDDRRAAGGEGDDPRGAPVGDPPAPSSVGLVLRWENTDTAGIYQFVLQPRDASHLPVGSETVRLVAVNVDPRESDLMMAQQEDLGRRLEGVSFDYVRGIEQLAESTGAARIELWRPLLIGIATVLLLEQGLAWYWGRKR